ncbi:unnamed protein product [Urochloa decumbens]|uniref:Uncharacterized protein n=1 Tax=Urochloa decumbens TaxID=240449 RepID=A0ABC9CQ38_9POAL
MSMMAAPPPPPPRLDSVLSFGTALPGADADRTSTDEPDTPAFSSDAGSDSDSDDAGFEFAFAPPLAAPGSEGAPDLAPADDLFAHGRILPAYPVFDRHLLHRDDSAAAAASPASPSPDTYCAWAPRSAPGSPTRERDAFPKSASTGEARRSWRLRDLVSGGAGGGRSHSDGKEKFLFLHSSTTATPSKMAGTKAAAAEAAGTSRQAARPSASTQKQSKKKGSGKAGDVTEMDMATAHKLFYGKPGGGALAGDKRQQQSYLPYRLGIVGFFTAAHALGRSHHPY